jgi:hypothetical protein
MATKFWTNQTVEMQSALGTAQTIDGISKASNGVVTKNAGATLPTNGQYVLLSIVGMRQLHQRVVKVSGASGSTFTIGIDTTQYDTFSSGSWQVVTFGNSFDSVREIQASGGDPVLEDVTTIHDVDDVEAIVSSAAQGFGWTVDWEPANAALRAANTAFVTRTPRAFRLADPDGSEYLFYATVTAALNPTVSGKKKVTPMSLRLKATGTAY